MPTIGDHNRSRRSGHSSEYLLLTARPKVDLTAMGELPRVFVAAREGGTDTERWPVPSVRPPGNKPEGAAVEAGCQGTILVVGSSGVPWEASAPSLDGAGRRATGMGRTALVGSGERDLTGNLRRPKLEQLPPMSLLRKRWGCGCASVP
jgi:hypothetical protein